MGIKSIMKNSLYGFIFFILLQIAPITKGFAQPGDSSRYHIAVFLPLYLDSAFDISGTYRFDQNFPKYLNPGLEFYEGLQLAMDSLQKRGAPLDITVYDTRSEKNTLQQMLDDTAFSKIQLIIGHVNVTELRLLAAAAKNQGIPFVNVNFPNDGGITGNPEFVILNSTLRTHCEAMYKFIQRNWATSNIYYVRRSSADDDRLKTYFTDIEKNTASVPLKMKWITAENNLTPFQLFPGLDSNVKNIFLVGSLDENFGKLISAKLMPLSKSYPMKVIGMPTWDAITDFNLPSYADLEIYYTSPFYISPADSLAISIQQNYRSRFYSRPSDMVYRGYETILHFGQLLVLHSGKLDGSVGVRKFRIFNDFDIQPVLTNKTGATPASQTLTLQYLENKKLYFIKKVNGSVVAVY
jgi:hypothetical protein